MVLAQDGFGKIVKLAGNIFKVRYYTETIGSVWDDDRSLTVSGNDIYTSGVLLTLDSTKGSEDQVLIEQGRIRYNDSKFFVGSEILTTSGIRVFTVSISGATNSVHDRIYREIVPGVNMPQYFALDIYKKIYVREGSLF